MKRLIFAGALAVSACAATPPPAIVQAAKTPAGALFCSLQLAGGGAILANVIQVGASSLLTGSAPLVALATNAGKSVVDQTCNDAAASKGAISGTAVSPPTDLNTQVTQVVVTALATPTAPAGK